MSEPNNAPVAVWEERAAAEELVNRLTVELDAARAVLARLRVLHGPAPGWERLWVDPAEALAEGWPRCAGCNLDVAGRNMDRCPTLAVLDGKPLSVNQFGVWYRAKE